MNLTTLKELCIQAGHIPGTPAGEYFIGAAIIAKSMESFRDAIANDLATERGNESLTIRQTAEEYNVSKEWIRTRIARDPHHHPIPLLINDGIQRIRRADFEAWLTGEQQRHQPRALKTPSATTAKKTTPKIPILRVEFPTQKRSKA